MAENLSRRDVIRLRKAMTSTQSDSFFYHLRNLLRAKLHFDTLLIMQFQKSGTPRLHNGWLRRTAALEGAMRQYLAGAYRLDPFYQYPAPPQDGAMYRLSEIAPDRFFTSEYYLRYYRKTQLCDEIGLLCPLENGSIAHLSLSRRAQAGPFKRKELQCLRHYSPLLLEMLRSHCNFRAQHMDQNAETPSRPLSQIIRTEAAETLGVKLTKRETQVAELVLQGHSNPSAALKLGMAYETAKVHRRNIYRKLGISSQGELFSLFKDVI
ncbi:response regulator transcription factor [Lentibacter sp. XHP0401]|jgi:DNA-binding CsgD family transcriptional regulator|uniref:response regulator transcription factor n=1 Tax=Lentibacter sp. XHP0401 TaxID=2984334 RepID=UPI0021E6E95F|nr:helix-turn-helix transcriptional regulator [Lentibacter sp. XHP0401]MCV2893499.1 helix-turn-helix transcriptional regulator [Lentibacter sp. XHP0401]